MRFYENPFGGNRVVPCTRTGGQTNMTKLIFASLNFAKAPNKCTHNLDFIYVYCIYLKINSKLRPI
jgi:hypothetical protein